MGLPMCVPARSPATRAGSVQQRVARSPSVSHKSHWAGVKATHSLIYPTTHQGCHRRGGAEFGCGDRMLGLGPSRRPSHNSLGFRVLSPSVGKCNNTTHVRPALPLACRTKFRTSSGVAPRSALSAGRAPLQMRLKNGMMAGRHSVMIAGPTKTGKEGAR